MGTLSLAALLQGFGLGASLIIAIGAQNAFVLRQGLRRLHVFATAAICSLCDALLILLGVAGFGRLIASNEMLTLVATWGGAAFLLYYGWRSFRAALKPGALDTDTVALRPVRLRETVLTTLAVSLLNPHVYVDTVMLIGSVGAQHPLAERASFASGAMLASFTWFFTLGYGASWLTPLFRKPAAWRVLDTMVGIIMWLIAVSLVWGWLTGSG